MKRKIKEKVILLLFVTFTSLCFCQNGFEFIQQDITEIIYAVSLTSKTPIVCDDTVSGRASFRFAGTDFDTAFESFLLTNRLYVNKSDTVWTVSRIKIEQSGQDNKELFNVDAYDVIPARLFEKISEETGTTIIHETLPNVTMSIHIKNVTVKEAVSLIMKSWSDYEISDTSNFIQIKRTQNTQNQNLLNAINTGKCDISYIRNSDDSYLYSLNLEKCSLGEVLENLFIIENKDFSNIAPSQTIIERLYAKDKSFEETLELVCAQCNTTFSKMNEVYIIHTSQNSTEKLIQEKTSWNSYTLKYIKADEIISLIQKRFTNINILKLSEFSIIYEIPASQNETLIQFIALCDVPKSSHIVKLQYIKPSYFLEHLPPSVSANQFLDTGSGNTLFFLGSEEAYNLLINELKEIDKPVTRIKYDLLILQVQETYSNKWNISNGIQTSKNDSNFDLKGVLSSVLSLNFDVVGTFGYSFASQLQTGISENKVQVYADTTLHGVSGTNIQFQNTNTYRYREPYVDSTTGETKNTGVTREIVSGLILDIEGWVSGDGMVTTTVKATVSRQGADVSSSTGNPPPTYEKQITTQVRGMAGEPVILTGLKQNDITESEQGTPWISKVPLIGWLFKGKDKTEENTEMIIYLVPHIDNEITESLEKFSIIGSTMTPIIEAIKAMQEGIKK